jgi:STE24 endopeptidase
MPLFNKFTPLEKSELRTKIEDYAAKVNFKFKNIFIIDGSKRSSHSNAFFTGFGSTI